MMETLAEIYVGLGNNSFVSRLRELNRDCHASDETIAALADPGIGPERREAVILHLSNCQRCREVIAHVVTSRSYVRDPD
jgi:hypothetical protein